VGGAQGRLKLGFCSRLVDFIEGRSSQLVVHGGALQSVALTRRRRLGEPGDFIKVTLRLLKIDFGLSKKDEIKLKIIL
jgi:hypothetical protein